MMEIKNHDADFVVKVLWDLFAIRYKDAPIYLASVLCEAGPSEHDALVIGVASQCLLEHPEYITTVARAHVITKADVLLRCAERGQVHSLALLWDTSSEEDRPQLWDRISEAVRGRAWPAYIGDVVSQEFWLCAREHGDPEGAYQLGLRQRFNETVQSATGAAPSFKEAADAGHPKAQYELGILLADGVGHGYDDREAECWLAIERRDHFQSSMQRIYPNASLSDLRSLGIQMIKGAADRGVGRAQIVYAWLLMSDQTLGADEDEAQRYFQEAFKTELSGQVISHRETYSYRYNPLAREALKYFTLCYLPDCRTSLADLKRAADSGDANAQVELGRCFLKATGKQSMFDGEALRYFEMAAASGNEIAGEVVNLIRSLEIPPSDTPYVDPGRRTADPDVYGRERPDMLAEIGGGA